MAHPINGDVLQNGCRCVRAFSKEFLSDNSERRIRNDAAFFKGLILRQLATPHQTSLPILFESFETQQRSDRRPTDLLGNTCLIDAVDMTSLSISSDHLGAHL